VAADFSCCSAHRAFGFGYLTQGACFGCSRFAPGAVSSEVAFRIQYQLLEDAISELAVARQQPVRADGRRYIVLTAADLRDVMMVVGLHRALAAEEQQAADAPARAIPHADGCPEVRRAREAVGADVVAASAGRSEADLFAALAEAETRAVQTMARQAVWYCTRAPPVFAVTVDYPAAAMHSYQAKNVRGREGKGGR